MLNDIQFQTNAESSVPPDYLAFKANERSIRSDYVNRALDDLLCCKRCRGDGYVPRSCRHCGEEHEDALTGETETDDCPACFGSTVEPLTVELVRAARLIVGMAPSGEPYMLAKLRLYEAAMLAIRYGTVAQHDVANVLAAAMGDET